MKTPKIAYAQMLGFGHKVTISQFKRWLNQARRMGYGGLTIVPALFPPEMTPDVVASLVKAANMQAMVCGFNPGSGPDPLENPDLVKKNLREQAQYTNALSRAQCGSRLIVGPTHTWHGQTSRKWDSAKFRVWMKTLDDLAREENIQIACEPLNMSEDGTPTALHTVAQAVEHLPRLGIHADSGHIHTLVGANWGEILRPYAHYVWYMELVNNRRRPCDVSAGIDFQAYRDLIKNDLGEGCDLGVEPFALSVVNQFGLSAICQKSVSGVECLRRDMAYFASLGLFQKVA